MVVLANALDLTSAVPILSSTQSSIMETTSQTSPFPLETVPSMETLQLEDSEEIIHSETSLEMEPNGTLLIPPTVTSEITVSVISLLTVLNSISPIKLVALETLPSEISLETELNLTSPIKQVALETLVSVTSQEITEQSSTSQMEPMAVLVMEQMAASETEPLAISLATEQSGTLPTMELTSEIFPLVTSLETAQSSISLIKLLVDSAILPQETSLVMAPNLTSPMVLLEVTILLVTSPEMVQRLTSQTPQPVASIFHLEEMVLS